MHICVCGMVARICPACTDPSQESPRAVPAKCPIIRTLSEDQATLLKTLSVYSFTHQSLHTAMSGYPTNNLKLLSNNLKYLFPCPGHPVLQVHFSQMPWLA